MVPFRHSLIFLATLGLLTACDNSSSPGSPEQPPTPTTEVPATPAETSSTTAESAETMVSSDQDQGEPTASAAPFSVTEVAQFDSPWAMTFLPDGRLLVTEMAGNLRLHDLGTGETGSIGGVPDVVHAGQGGKKNQGVSERDHECS
jgi:aldose sugar dehydrogenase